MPTPNKRSSSPSAVAKTALEQATLALSELPEKPRDIWSLKEAVAFMQESITAALDKGYSHEEVAGMLAQNGVDIRAASLKYYLAALKRDQDSTTKTKTRRTRRPRAAKAESAALSAGATPATTTLSEALTSDGVSSETPAIESLNGSSAGETAATPKRRTRSTAGTRGKTAAASKTAAKTKSATGAKPRAAAKPKATATKTTKAKSTSPKTTTPKTTSTRRRKKTDSTPE